MSALLDYADAHFAWHPDWPAARTSNWHLLPDLDALRAKWRKRIAVPRTPKPVQHINYCGGCYRRFCSSDSVVAAFALQQHIEQTPCMHYAA
jgi:hypothetical protein